MYYRTPSVLHYDLSVCITLGYGFYHHLVIIISDTCHIIIIMLSDINYGLSFSHQELLAMTFLDLIYICSIYTAVLQIYHNFPL